MFCKQCGAKLEDDAQFCENCGNIINRIVSEAPVNAASEPINAQEQNAVSAKTSAEIVSNKKAKKRRFIGVVIGVAILIIGTAFGIIMGGSVGKTSNIYSESNFNNGAQFAYDNSRLYFVGLFNEGDKDTVVYSTDYKGVNKTLISDNGDIIEIRICNGRIYYKASSNDKYTIGVMNIDGSSDTTIVTSSESIERYDVYGNKLFYLINSEIHCCDLTGENDISVLDSVDTFTVCNGFIYFVDNKDVINSYRIKNKEIKELCKASGANCLSVDGNTLYFACDTGLSSVSLSGDNSITKVIRDSSLRSYVFYDGFVYYNHQMSNDDINSLAEYMSKGENANNVIFYKLAMIGAGSIYKAPMSGGDGESVVSDQFLIYSLHSYPQGLYCKLSPLSYSFKPVDLE